MLFRRRARKRRSLMPSFDKVAKSFLEELRQTTNQMNTVTNNQETVIGQNTKIIDLLQQIKRSLQERAPE